MKKNWIIPGLIVLLSVGCLYSAAGDKLPITTTSETARTYFLQAREMADQLKAPEAVNLFTKAIMADPDFALAYAERSQFDNSGKAFLDDVNKAVALRDKVSDGEKLVIDALQENVNGNVKMELENLEKVISMYPNDERLHLLLGQVQQRNQNYDKALSEFQKAIKINPQFSPVYNMMGYLYKNLGKFTEAEIAFKKYISLVPNEPNPYDSYAELLLKEGKFEMSIQNYQKALNIDPSFNSSKTGIFAAYLYQNKISEAEKQATDILDNSKTNLEMENAHRLLAISYAYEGKFDQALSELDKQYQLCKNDNDYPDMSNIQLVMGQVYLENGMFDKANDKFKMALNDYNESPASAESKNNFRNTVNYNQSLVSLKRVNTSTLAGAKSEADVIVLDQKTLAQTQLSHQLKAISAIEQKDPDLALNELKEANQLDPYVYYLRGRAYQLKGDNNNAKTWFDKAINDNELPTFNGAFAHFNAKKYSGNMK